MTTDLPEGFEVVVNRSLTERIMFAGLPKRFALLLWTPSVALILGLYQLWVLPISVALHFLFVGFAKRDPYFFDVFRRAVRRQKSLLP